MGEAAAAHRLHNFIGVRQAHDVHALGFVGGAHSVQRVALASAGFTPEDRKTFRAGQLGQGVGLFRFQRVGGCRRRYLAITKPVRMIGGKALCVALQRHF